MKKLEELLAICKKATPGPWNIDPGTTDKYELDELDLNDGEITSANGKSILKSWDYEGYSSGVYIRPEDSKYIETFNPELVQALLKEVLAARKYLNVVWERHPLLEKVGEVGAVEKILNALDAAKEHTDQILTSNSNPTQPPDTESSQSPKTDPQ